MYRTYDNAVNRQEYCTLTLPPKQTSFQNIFPGTIKDITLKKSIYADVKLDIGVPIIARITIESLLNLKLEPGMKIMALIKSMDVSFGEYS